MGDVEKLPHAGLFFFYGLSGYCMEQTQAHVTPPLSESTIKQLMSISMPDGKTVFDKMHTVFLELAPIRMDTIRNSIEREAWSLVEREAHKMISSCGSIGGAALSERFRKLEDVAGQRARQRILPLFREIEIEFKSLCYALGNVVSESAS